MSFAAHIAGGFAGMSIGYTVFSCFDQALLKDPRFWTAIAAYLAFVLFATRKWGDNSYIWSFRKDSVNQGR